MSRLEALRHPLVWVPVSIALLLLVVAQSGLWDAPDRLERVNPLTLAVAAAVAVLVVGLWAIRAAVLLVSSGHRVTLTSQLPLTLMAFSLNNVTPASTGELFRLYVLRLRYAVPYATGAGVIAIERLVPLFYMGTTAPLAWIAHLGLLPSWATVALLLVIAGAPFVIVSAGLRPAGLILRLPGSSRFGEDRYQGWRREGSRFDDTLRACVGRPVPALLVAAATLAIFGCFSLQLMLVGAALGTPLDPLVAWGALGLALLVGILSLLPFGLGSSDLTLAGVLASAGVGLPEATLITFGYRIVSTLPLATAGAVAYAYLSSARR